jgi:hypothetical protein
MELKWEEITYQSIGTTCIARYAYGKWQALTWGGLQDQMVLDTMMEHQVEAVHSPDNLYCIAEGKPSEGKGSKKSYFGFIIARTFVRA